MGCSGWETAGSRLMAHTSCVCVRVACAHAPVRVLRQVRVIHLLANTTNETTLVGRWAGPADPPSDPGPGLADAVP
jgi:hypothetical protein